MQARFSTPSYICSRCLRASLAAPGRQHDGGQIRRYRASPQYLQSQDVAPKSSQEGSAGVNHGEEEGAMSRRLSEMSDSMLESSPRDARKVVDEAGFSDELKRQLQDRISGAKFASDNAQAFARANLPSSAGAGTQDLAGARPWSGNESVEDASLRMLDDAHKKMRVPARVPGVRMPRKVDTGRSTAKAGGSSGAQGARLANARDKSSMYSYLNDAGVSEAEREQMRKELKERFTPGARTVPATIQGLASLANERIEDAIARGQFKNLPRGKAIERDYTASSPFLDTTEYFMNKIIQKQEIVPPWIEKQQELVSTASKFRARLRSDWKRHVARLIASKGGSLERQVALADEYARAEAVDNPPKSKVETVNTVDSGGHLSQITLTGQLQTSGSEAPVETFTVTETPLDTPTKNGDTVPVAEVTSPALVATDAIGVATTSTEQANAAPPATPLQPPPTQPLAIPSVTPFRDPAWLATESSYQELAITNLNALTRSYNLMAPNLAKKPYFSLERELRACYADVAPLVAAEIRERARTPPRKVEEIRHKEGGVLERFSGGGKSVVYDEVRPKYGFKEFWRDLFAARQT